MEQAINTKNKYLVPLMTLTVLFFMWGFITCLNDMLTPYFKAIFNLSGFKANLVQFAFFMAYFVVSLIYFTVSAVWQDPIRKIGYKTTILAGLIISASACLIFCSEASKEVPQYEVFLMALFILGTGFTFLQISANPLVSILGTQESSSSRLNLSQGFNSLGTTLAPVIGALVIFGGQQVNPEDTPDQSTVQLLYLCLAGVLILLAVLIFFSNIPNLKSENDNVTDKIGALRYPHVIFGMLAIFFYVGGEVTIGNNLVHYMTSAIDFIPDEKIAGKFLSFYWGGAMIGRFAGSIYMSDMNERKKLVSMVGVGLAIFGLIFMLTGLDFMDICYFLIFMALNFGAFIATKGVPSRTLGLFAIANMILVAGMVMTTGTISLWLILAVGLFNSIMFSNVFTLAIKWLGKYTSQASSLLVMMILGGAIMPPLQGFIADRLGDAHIAFILPIICYLYLAWYGFKGCNIKNNKLVYVEDTEKQVISNSNE